MSDHPVSGRYTVQHPGTCVVDVHQGLVSYVECAHKWVWPEGAEIDVCRPCVDGRCEHEKAPKPEYTHVHSGGPWQITDAPNTHIGEPYQFGGDASEPFDCSDMTEQVWSRIDLYRWANRLLNLYEAWTGKTFGPKYRGYRIYHALFVRGR